MAETSQIVENYFSMWNETDAEKRQRIIEDLWTADAKSVDPLVAATGHAEIEAMVSRVQTDYPGHLFSKASDISEHNDRIFFRFEMKNADGDVQLAGCDCVRMEAGKFADLSGFWV